MERFLIFAAVSVLVVARPEMYKEQEDFQYSRSSSDDGSKSGYYGAQRGNMGGNYERAHNMDSLAQNQMSGLVRQVEGELGDGAKTRAGSVYSAANSRGTYGAGHFDLSNLNGRNFQEGAYHDSQSSASLTRSSSLHNSADYARSNSHSSSNSRYAGYQTSDAQTQTDDLQSVDSLPNNNQYYNYNNRARHSSGFQSQAGFQEHGEYDHNDASLHSGYGSKVQSRLVSTTPVRVILTPVGRVAIPVAVQTYDANHAASASEQSVQNHDSVIIPDMNLGYRPSDSKHYESSYSYRKKWEKHDTIPSSVSLPAPTDAPIPRNSELLEDSEGHTQFNRNMIEENSRDQHSSSASDRYSGMKSSLSQSGYQSNYNTRQRDSSSSDSNAFRQTGYRAGASGDVSADSNFHTNAKTRHNGRVNSDLNSQVEDLDTRPKSYQSSYSYHKSWERQGDPYVIKPASGGYYDNQASQRLTNHRYTASNHNQNQADCDENEHIRIARSSYTDNNIQQQNQNLELGQQIQNPWQNENYLSQQSQSAVQDIDNTEGFDQQSLNLQRSNVEQQSQNKWENLDDLNQHSQNNWEPQNVGQQTQNLEDIGQQSQINWEQNNHGQESQNNWELSENLGQQSEKNWGGQSLDHNTWTTFEDITQQHKNPNNNQENLRKHDQSILGEHDQDNETKQVQQLEFNKSDIDFHSRPENKSPHNVETPWDKFDILDANKSNKSKSEHKTENSEFYWHHIPSNGAEEQQVNKLNANGDIISDMETYHANLYTNSNSEQANEYVSFNNNYNNQNIHYSYSNGFVNPTIYNKRYLNSPYETAHHVDRDNTYGRNSESHRNSESQVTQQEDFASSNSSLQTTSFQHNSNYSQMSGFWKKIEAIEKESNLSENFDDKRYFTELQKHSKDLTYLSQHNFTSINTQTETTSKSTLSQTDKEMRGNVITENHIDLKQTSMLPNVNKYSVNDTNLPKEIKSSNITAPETLEDIGRGDIGTDDFYNKADVAVIVPTYNISDDIPAPDYNTHQITVNNKIHDSNVSDSKLLNVLILEQQTAQKDENCTIITDVHIDNSTVISGYNKTSNFTHKHEDDVIEHSNINNGTTASDNVLVTIPNIYQTQSSNKYGGDFGQQQYQGFELTNRETKLKDTPNIVQNNLGDLGGQNQNKQSHNLNQETLLQHNINFEEQNLHKFEQEYQQEFVESNLEQQNLHYLEQQNTQNFEQQNENIEQQNFEQTNLQEFAHENKNLEEQSLYNFGQDHLREFTQPTGQEQTLHNFRPGTTDDSKESGLIQQNVHTFEQESENQHDLQQENVDNFQLQNEGQVPENLHDFGQKQNEEQQTFLNFDNQNDNMQSLSQSKKLYQVEDTKNQIQQQEVVEEPAVIQKKLRELESSSKFEKVEAPIEAVTEKPGFWKSIGNKFTSAKNKVVTWFNS